MRRLAARIVAGRLLARPRVIVAVAVLASVFFVGFAALSGLEDGSRVDTSPDAVVELASGQIGLRVAGVQGASGLRAGDVVVAVDHVELGAGSGSVPTPAPGQTLTYSVVRDGARIQVPVTLSHPSPVDDVAVSWAVYLVPLVLLPIGAGVYLRRPGVRAAQLMLACGALLLAGTVSSPAGPRVVDLVSDSGRLWLFPLSEIANALLWAALLHFTLVFPEPSRLVTGRRGTVAAVYLLPFLGYGVWLAASWSEAPAWPGRELLVSAVSEPAGVYMPGLIAVSLVLAYRRATDPAVRQRMRWVVGTLAGSSAAYVAFGAVPNAVTGRPLASFVWLQMLFVSVPIAVAAAILTHQLFDLNLIIKRSIVYAMLTLAMLGLYVGALAGLARLLPTHSVLVAAIAGGAAALLFRPVHDAAQRVVQRWVYGSRSNPYEVVSQIGHIDEQALPTVLDDLTKTLSRTLRLSYAGIEILDPDGDPRLAASTGTAHGPTQQVPLHRGNRPIGQLVLSVRHGREPFGPGDARLLDELAAHIGRVVEIVNLNDALQHSRAELVTAREEERRRLHRDLHDGIGPSLAAQAMQIDLARLLVGQDPSEAGEVLASLGLSTQNLIAEIRRVVDDLRPRSLDQLGLASALREAARSFTTANPDRALSVTVDIDGDLAELPAAVEVALYRIATEALANAARHSGARRCQIRIAMLPGTVTVAVIDDGAGIPADHRPGVGTRSMRERADELGGRLEITRNPHGGSSVIAQLPLIGSR